MKMKATLGLGALLSAFTLLTLVPQAHAENFQPGQFICWGIATIDFNNGTQYAADCYSNQDVDLFGQAYVNPTGPNSADLDLLVVNGQHHESHCNGAVQCTASFGSLAVTEPEGDWTSQASFLPTSVTITCSCQAG